MVFTVINFPSRNYHDGLKACFEATSHAFSASGNLSNQTWFLLVPHGAALPCLLEKQIIKAMRFTEANFN